MGLDRRGLPLMVGWRGKAGGDADQIAATNLYLMENGFVTGTALTVDGGFILTAS